MHELSVIPAELAFDSQLLHSKKKGNIGQAAAALEFAKLGFSVFIEQGDISPIDLLVERDGRVIRLQCKAARPKNGQLSLPVRKCGPSYTDVYNQTQFDFFCLYDLDNHEVYLIPSYILRSQKSSFALRLVKPKNNQVKGLNFADDFRLSNVASTLLRRLYQTEKPSKISESDRWVIREVPSRVRWNRRQSTLAPRFRGRSSSGRALDF